MTAGALTAVRWVENYHLFILGVLTLAVAHLGRGAPEPLGETAITGIVTSYIGLLTAFYADNGKNLPLWRDPSPAAYWLAPALWDTAYCSRCCGTRCRGTHNRLRDRNRR